MKVDEAMEWAAGTINNSYFPPNMTRVSMWTLAAEVARLQSEHTTIRAALVDIRDNYDCDEDNHKYHGGYGCRSCGATLVLESLGGDK